MYALAICKGDYVCSVESALVPNRERIEAIKAAQDRTNPLSTGCYRAVVSTELPFTILKDGEDNESE
jgi:hypothetical protein